MSELVKICPVCEGSGFTGWYKPMGYRPDGTINMVFVPQRCLCSAQQDSQRQQAIQANLSVI